MARSTRETHEASRSGYGGSFTAALFRWSEGKGAWYFVPVPERLAPSRTLGWGRASVTATVDGKTWATSVWREKSGRTLLAVPKHIRGSKDDGDRVRVTLRYSTL
jgi:hypothetical protein